VSPSLTRRCAVLLAASALPLLATPASADVPEGWSEPPPVSLLEMLVLIAGIPLVLIVLIVLAVLLPGLARGEKLRSTAAKDEWFGGPRPSRELEPSRPVGPTGGASGRW